MANTILVQSPVVERTNQNHSHGRISQTVDCRLMRFYLSINGKNQLPARGNKMESILVFFDSIQFMNRENVCRETAQELFGYVNSQLLERPL